MDEQQKNQRALNIKNRFLKQTHDIKLTEKLSPITKKLEEVKESTQKVGDMKKNLSCENENIKEIVADKIRNIP